jgi:mono/diheme cytochrome c family protein
MKVGFSAVAIVGVLGVCALCATLGADQSPPVQQGLAISPAPTSRSVLDGVYTEDQARRGQPIYARECAQCHGSMLEGGEEAPALSGGGFTSNWNGLTIGDVFDRIRRTMPSDNPGRLSPEGDADVLAYMLSVGKFPAGNAELSAQTEVLKQIRFEPPKPQH